MNHPGQLTGSRPAGAPLMVGIPAMNSARTLPATLASIQPLRQVGAQVFAGYSPSADGTREMLEGSVDGVIEVPAGNMYRAVNAALRSSRSWEWGTYLNSDDLLYGDAVLRALEDVGHHADLIYGNIEYIDDSGRFLHSYRSMRPPRLTALFGAGVNPIPQQGTLFRRKLFEDLGGFDEQFRFSSDYDFFLRAVMSKARVVRWPGATMAAFRLHTSQISQRYAEAMKDESATAVRASGLRVSAGRRLWAMGMLRLTNADHLLLRVLRHAHLSGRIRLPRTMGIPVSSGPSE